MSKVRTCKQSRYTIHTCIRGPHLLIHSIIRSSSIHAFSCVVQTTPSGTFTFFRGLNIFPLKIKNDGRSFPAVVQHKVAVICCFCFFQRPLCVREYFFPFLVNYFTIGTMSRKTGVSSVLQIYFRGLLTILIDLINHFAQKR